MIESTDQYVYPGTDVLRNLRNIQDPAVFCEFEAEATASRILELSELKGDLSLQAIHKYIFQDVFAWAGEFRTVNISKGGHSFGRADFIEPFLHDLFRKLAKENHRRGLDRETFIPRAAFFLGEINAVHPFREGNGRTQREFIRRLAESAGFKLKWLGITRDQMIDASRTSFLTGDSSDLADLISACISYPC